MSRIGNMVVIGIVTMVAIYGRRLAVDIMGPGTMLYEMGSSGMYGSPALAARTFEAVTVWVPWLCVIGIIAAGLYREFATQRVSQQRRVR
jgi:hypothetical protein